MKKRRILVGTLTFLLFSRPFTLPHAETVRDRATLHFLMNRWSVQPKAVPHAPLPAIDAPGGDESFVALKISGDSTVPAVYPEAEGLGILDYSGITESRLRFLDEIGNGFLEKTVDPARCSADRPFLSPVAVFKLERLPSVTQSLYARPEDLGASLLSVRYRLTVTSGTERKFVYVTVIVSGSETSPAIDDIIFDGLSYANAAQ
jgi:hypothetical protein